MVIEKLISDLKRDEGFKSYAYRDSVGLWSIGHGRMIDKRHGGGISEVEADYLLRNDVENTLKELDRVLPWWRDLPEPARRALCNMCFNLGMPTLYRFQKMLTALQLKDYTRAADEALASKWARQVGDRAQRIASLYRSCA